MKTPIQRYLIPGLAVLCGIAAIGLVPAIYLPRAESGSVQEKSRAVAAPGMASLDEESPTMPEVVAKHLFIKQRKATGQNSFSDLVVKGIFLGTEKSVVLSLKSKPQANLRVWVGRVDSALSQITDPRDPRQSIATFLREWNLKDITTGGVVMEHFITGETETYAVNYTPVKKVKDDAERGYGQGIIPQVGEGGSTAVAKSSGATSPAKGTVPTPAGTSPISLMAGRISEVMKRMSPDQQKQLLREIGQNTGGPSQKSGNSAGSASKNSPKSSSNGSSSGTKSKTKKN